MKHTPGPWEVETLFCGDIRIINERKDRTFPEYQAAIDAGERKANARLVAAAPEMLEGIEAVCRAYVMPEGIEKQLALANAIMMAAQAAEKAKGA